MNLIVFDFDGTIVDSFAILIKTTNCLARDFGYSPISSSQIPLMRTLSLRERIQQLGIPKWKLPFFLRRFRQELNQFMSNLQLVEGMKEILLEIEEHNYRLGIVTSNSRHNVEDFLRLQKLNHLFEFIYGGLLSGKTSRLKKLVKLNQFNPQQLIYVGDETSDIKAAKGAGVTNIAVSWGFNTQDVLAKEAPDVLIDRPDQLLAAIELIG